MPRQYNRSYSVEKPIIIKTSSWMKGMHLQGGKKSNKFMLSVCEDRIPNPNISIQNTSEPFLYSFSHLSLLSSNDRWYFQISRDLPSFIPLPPLQMQALKSHQLRVCFVYWVCFFGLFLLLRRISCHLSILSWLIILWASPYYSLVIT